MKEFLTFTEILELKSGPQRVVSYPGHMLKGGSYLSAEDFNLVKQALLEQ